MDQVRHDMLGWLASTATAIGDLPAAIHLFAGVGLVVGLIMWLLGKKLLKPAFALLGMFVGGVLGFLLAATVLPATVVGVPAIYLGLGVGAVLGLVQGLATFRFAMAISASLIVAIAATLGAAAWMKFEPLQRAAEVAGRSPIELAPEIRPPSLTSAENLKAAMKPVGEQVGAFVDEAREQLRQEWIALSTKQQTTIVLSALGGALVGLIFGLVFPTRASAGLTAMLGTAVWLPAAAWLLAAADVPFREHLRQSALVWLIVWIIVAAVGWTLQLTVMNRRKTDE